MKKFFIPAFVAVAAISGAISYFNQSPQHELNALAIANLEAISYPEVPEGWEVVVVEQVSNVDHGTFIREICTRIIDCIEGGEDPDCVPSAETFYYDIPKNKIP